MKKLPKLLLFVGMVCALGLGSAVAQDNRFDILEYVVEGTTLIPAITVEQAVYPHLGEGKSFDDVEKARDALEKGDQPIRADLPHFRLDVETAAMSAEERRDAAAMLLKAAAMLSNEADSDRNGSDHS